MGNKGQDSLVKREARSLADALLPEVGAMVDYFWERIEKALESVPGGTDKEALTQKILEAKTIPQKLKVIMAITAQLPTAYNARRRRDAAEKNRETKTEFETFFARQTEVFKALAGGFLQEGEAAYPGTEAERQQGLWALRGTLEQKSIPRSLRRRTRKDSHTGTVNKMATLKRDVDTMFGRSVLQVGIDATANMPMGTDDEVRKRDNTLLSPIVNMWSDHVKPHTSKAGKVKAAGRPSPTQSKTCSRFKISALRGLEEHLITDLRSRLKPESGAALSDVMAAATAAYEETVRLNGVLKGRGAKVHTDAALKGDKIGKDKMYRDAEISSGKLFSLVARAIAGEQTVDAAMVERIERQMSEQNVGPTDEKLRTSFQSGVVNALKALIPKPKKN